MTPFPLNMDQCIAMYRGVHADKDNETMRHLAQTDLFYLLVCVLHRLDAMHPWIFDRCREVQAEPNGMLDLWSRAHYKSTIITFALSIQEILNNPEVTIGIFSHTGDIAQDFLNQIKTEFEKNEQLKALFPDILYDNPEREADKWGKEAGIQVKRRANPKEATVEAWALGKGTGRHFDIRVYDDVVTESSVTTPEMIQKTTDHWRHSMNLGRTTNAIVRYIGTRYHLNDTYRAIIESGAAKPRIRLATHNGKMDGDLAILSRKELREKRDVMGPYIFSCQIMQNPVADRAMGFKEEWLKFFSFPLPSIAGWNLYLLIDPASKKKKENDYTVMLVIGLAPDGNYYVIDGVRDRLNLTERADQVFKFHRKYMPTKTGYEEYGLQADIEHIEDRMGRENYRFNITATGGNKPAKEDRIRRLVPTFELGHVYWPNRLLFVDREMKQRDLTNEFITEEYGFFPVATHDDIFDCLARIKDPKLATQFPVAPAVDDRKKPRRRANTKHKVYS